MICIWGWVPEKTEPEKLIWVNRLMLKVFSAEKGWGKQDGTRERTTKKWVLSWVLAEPHPMDRCGTLIKSESQSWFYYLWQGSWRFLPSWQSVLGCGSWWGEGLWAISRKYPQHLRDACTDTRGTGNKLSRGHT